MSSNLTPSAIHLVTERLMGRFVIFAPAAIRAGQIQVLTTANMAAMTADILSVMATADVESCYLNPPRMMAIGSPRSDIASTFTLSQS